MAILSFMTGRSDGAGGTGGAGLAVLCEGSIKVGHDDWNQAVNALIAGLRFYTERAGGEGIYDGGAAVVGDFGGAGTTYPPVSLLVEDDAADVWPKITAAYTAIDFSAIASGAGKLYAVLGQLAGVSPAAGDGATPAVTFVALPSASAAPAHSLLLGAGTVTASAFTTWTPQAGTFIVINRTDRLDPEYPGVAWVDPGAAVTCVPTEGVNNHYVVAEDANVQAQVMWRVPDTFSAWKATSINISHAATGAAPDSTVKLYIDTALIDTYTLAASPFPILAADLATAVAGSIVSLWFDLNGCYSGYGSNEFQLGWIDFLMEVTT